MNSGKLLVFLMASVLTLACFSCTTLAQPLMVEKNLFSSDRKPTTDEVPDAESAHKGPGQAGLPPKSVQLDGVFIRQDVKKALVRVSSQILGEATKGKGRRDQFPYMTISEGESIGDFKVVKIDSRSVSLEKDKQVYVIGLFMDGKVVPPAAQLPAAPTTVEPEKGPPAADGSPSAAAPAVNQPHQAQASSPQPNMPPAPASPAGERPPTAPPNVNNLPMPPGSPVGEPGTPPPQE
jgi:hypothetical protein